MSCGYTGHHFGAHYEDAVCIDGFLWDLDSDDGDGLTHGGDHCCPQCNLPDWLASICEDFSTSADGVDSLDDQLWHKLLRQFVAVASLHDFATVGKHVATLKPAVLYWTKDDNPDDLPAQEICWPFPVDHLDISGHDKIALVSGAVRAPEASLIKGLWLRPALD